MSTLQDDDVTLCATCAVEHAAPLPAVCAICADERQWVPADGQHWTSLAELTAAGTHLSWAEPEPGRVTAHAEPRVGIGQTMQVITGTEGTVVWDPTGFVDEAAVARVRSYGPVLAVVASHPHMFGVQVAWGHALEAPVLVVEADLAWVARPDPIIQTWSEHRDLGPVSLHQVGGHFPGSAVALWPAGAHGRGTLLTGDTISPNPDRRTVAFLRSYPNRIPLSAGVVRRIADQLAGLRFDAIIGNFANEITAQARTAVAFSAERHIAWVRGDHDDLT